MLRFPAPIPLSLYIHIPWCVKKCPYCDFNSHVVKHGIPEEQYITALLQDLDEQRTAIAGRSIVSIFFGGGTPSLFSPHAIEKILSGVYQRCSFIPNIEITLEANPGTVDETHFKGFRAAGINRLSLGIQSLQDEKLRALGRIHNSELALHAVDAAMAAGFHNFNLDLMHGLPNQSRAEAVHDLTQALAFQPPHLSWYQLTIEPNTLFHHKRPTLPQEDTLWDIQDAGHALLTENHFQQYEISAYAKPNHQCQHNKNYWTFGDYLGLGAGAHSKLTHRDTHCITRHWQTKHPNDYLSPQTPFTAEKKIISAQDIGFEFMLNALRLMDGFDQSLFETRTGLPLAFIYPKIALAKQKELLVEKENRFRATLLGQRFLNNLLELFLP